MTEKEIIDYVKTFEAEKIAVLGQKDAGLTLVKFLVSSLPVRRVKYFTQKEEALMWLKNDNLR